MTDPELAIDRRPLLDGTDIPGFDEPCVAEDVGRFLGGEIKQPATTI
jgi:hypothetical protein